MSMIGQTIYYYHFSQWEGINKGEAQYNQDEFKVLAENADYLCMDNWHFETICQPANSNFDHDIVLNKPKISLDIGSNSTLGGYISYTLYSTKPISTDMIKKQIEKHIKKKLKFFNFEIDLSVITSKTNEVTA